MPPLAVFFWILNILTDTAGHLAFKSAAAAEQGSELGRWRRMLTAVALWIGIGCFCVEFVAWYALLSLVPLSLAVLIGSINIVAVMLAGRMLFGERLDAMRVAGMCLVAIGVGLAAGFA